MPQTAKIFIRIDISHNVRHDLFEQLYFKDIVERNKIRRTDILDALVNMLASSVGSLTNPQKLYDTFRSHGEKELSLSTIISYLSCLEDAFIVKKALRYDVKGKKYISTPHKYYFADTGLRNARLNFRQQEETHLMENAIYNELVLRGYNVWMSGSCPCGKMTGASRRR